MNKRQKELLQLQLDNEKAVLKKLQGIYKKALDDVNNHIAALMGRTDSENLQSIVYQLNYQKALKTQINGILGNLASNQYTTISDYLANCYENGFIGTMYDLHGQGIPLLFPLNQDLVVRAVQNEAPLVDAFYDYLGEDVKLLKKRVANNISRGMAQGSSYAEIARNIERGMIGDYSKVNGGAMYDAYRIARTEGHRITNAATHDAQVKAKDAGADVVKQWDATMDRRTRKSHARVDGEIREIDDTFSNGLMYPGDSAGSAAEVINCRCACLQRAKWALDDDELQMLEARAEFFGLDKTKNFEDFKQKYLKAAENVASQAAKTAANSANNSIIQLDLANYSDAFTSKAAEKKNTKALIDYVNALPDADQRTIELYNSMGKMDKFGANGISFSITHTKNHAVSVSYRLPTGKIAEVKLNIPKLSGANLAGQVNTTLHEQMHLIDLMLRDDPTVYGKYFAASSPKLVSTVQKTTSDIGADVLDLFKKHGDEYKILRTALKKEYDDAIIALKKQYIPNGAFALGADYKAYKKASDKAWKDIMETKHDYEARNIMGGGIGELQDIYDALSGGKHRDSGAVLYGHGSKYYSSTGKRIDEIIANYGALSVTRPDLIDMLRKDKPDLVAALEEVVEEMRKKVSTIV